MSDLVQDLLNRASDLAGTGPGSVEVAKTTDVAFVRALRELTSALDDESRQRVRAAIGEVDKVLTGIEGDDVPLEEVRPWYRRDGILLYIDLIRAPKKTMAEMKAVRGRAEHNRKLLAAGGPKQRAAPAGLVKAAEAWLVANMSDPGVVNNEQRATLSEPWMTARVDSTTEAAD